MATCRDNQLGPYRLVKWLGAGGMGQVWEAVDCTRGGARVALKVMSARAGSMPGDAMREARIGLGMEHPNIAQTLDVGFAGGRAYLVLELLRGGTLAELWPVPAPPLPAPCVAGVALQALAGLHHAHTSLDESGRARRLVHRDVKGSNLFLTQEGHVKLLDFGIASTAAAPRDAARGREGTLAYMAPELLAGESGDARSDLYALALVAAELLAGRPALEGLDDARARAAILAGDVAPLGALPVDVPAGVRRWLEIALRAEPRERFDDAASMARALQTCVGDAWSPRALAAWYAALPQHPQTRRAHTRRLDHDEAASIGVAAPPMPSPAACERRDAPAARPWETAAPPAARFAPTSAERRVVSAPTPPPPRRASAGAQRGARGDRWLVRSMAGVALLLVVGGWPLPTDRDAPRGESRGAAATTTRGSSASAVPGWITVESRPDAHIRVAGRDVGEAPVVRYGLAPGRYVVEAIQRDGTRRHQRVRISPGRGELVFFQ